MRQLAGLMVRHAHGVTEGVKRVPQSVTRS